jgi:hypothetical protein
VIQQHSFGFAYSGLIFHYYLTPYLIANHIPTYAPWVKTRRKGS